MDLIRQLLVTLESHEHGFAPRGVNIEGFTQEQIGYHATLIIEGGLAIGHDVTTRGASSPQASLQRLTWSGHEFLDAAREPSRWQQAREVIDKAGGASIAVWTSVLTELLKKSIGI